MAGGRPFTPQDDDTILRVFAETGGDRGWVHTAAKAIGRSAGSVVQRKGHLKSVGKFGDESGAPTAPKEAADPDTPEFASPITSAPLSVDDIVRMFKIDLLVWEPYHITPNVWQMGAKHPETGEIVTAPLYQTKVRFRRLAPPAVHLLRDALLADVRADTATRKRVLAPKRSTGRRAVEQHALEVDEFDIHLNKLAWAAETGQNYDSDIAEERARAAMVDLLAMATPYAIEKIILPIGNDLTNADTLSKTTTGGTPQDTDTRYHRMFRRARALTSWMIAECAAIAPVEVVIVPGNHDQLTTWTVGQVLEAEYANDSRVVFQSGPRLRKYVQYGQNLIGFTHGVDEPHANLPQIMAVEQAAVWSQTTYREWHVGHLHKQKATQPIIVDDKIGVTVRVIRALTGTDAWHASRGYVGVQQGAEAFVWRRSGGLRAHLYHDAQAARSA
jgi:hypothetical protein